MQYVKFINFISPVTLLKNFVTVLFRLGGKSTTKYEPISFNDSPKNWTSALQDFVGEGIPPARIASVDELCDAQTYISPSDSQYEFWTALKRSNDGQYKWGLSLNESANLRNRDILFDETQPGYCYAIDKFVMKLKSKDCNSLLRGALTTYEDADGKRRPREVPLA